MFGSISFFWLFPTSSLKMAHCAHSEGHTYRLRLTHRLTPRPRLGLRMTHRLTQTDTQTDTKAQTDTWYTHTKAPKWPIFFTYEWIPNIWKMGERIPNTFRIFQFMWIPKMVHKYLEIFQVFRPPGKYLNEIRTRSAVVVYHLLIHNRRYQLMLKKNSPDTSLSDNLPLQPVNIRHQLLSSCIRIADNSSRMNI